MVATPINIDERWFEEWFVMGWDKLIEYLAGWAMFDAWCLDHEQENDVQDP
jgi:hypothetical protein